ncbi:hypothetical protein E3Q23_01317 [Wallemia mellicola]|nr:hypothetical protein E3Q23_01317 [Wallemia mellicola]
MINNLIGRPSEQWRRTQVVLVILFWLWRLLKGDRNGLRFWYIKSINRRLKRFTPYQIIVATLTTLYAIRHFDALLGLQAPEPLAHLYSRSYYRATWLSNALDAGFATAMSIRKPKWLKDLAGPVFGLYYLFWTAEADEKIRAVTFLGRPRCRIVREVLLPRPKSSKYTKPISCLMFFDGTQEELEACTELVMDFPGGAFVFMTPRDHEERLRWWAKEGNKKVILSVNYGKSPEYPFPWAIDEAFDLYNILLETNGRLLGIQSDNLNILLAGDSAGGNIVTVVMFKILESEVPLKHPVGIVLTYPALDFNFTSWMSDENLEVLRTEQSSVDLASLFESKDHLAHKSPLSVTCDVPEKNIPRRKSWSNQLSHWASSNSLSNLGSVSPKAPYSAGAQIASATVMQAPSKSTSSLRYDSNSPKRRRLLSFVDDPPKFDFEVNEQDVLNIDTTDTSESDKGSEFTSDSQKPLYERVIAEPNEHVRRELQKELQKEHMKANERIRSKKKEPIGTRLTMTSRSGFFNDRIIPPSVMRACALLYIGPKNRPDFKTDYYISPILAPSHLLEQFPTTLIICGERDPFVDDSLIFAGRLRKAKLARQAAAMNEQNNFNSSNEMMTPTDGLGLNIPQPKGDHLEDHIVHEDEDDWVHLRIIEGMSHGFLQMTGVFKESLLIVKKMNQWIEESFLHALEKENAENAEKERLEREKKDVSENLPNQSRKGSEHEYEEPLVFSTKKAATLSTVFSEPPTQIHTPNNDQLSQLRVPPRAHSKPHQKRTQSTPPPLVIKTQSSDRRKSFEKEKKKEEMNNLLLTEAEVLRRRRLEAVMGMVGSSVDLPPLETAINCGVTAISRTTESVDEASKLLSIALTKFRHITDDYAREYYEKAFNWDEIELPLDVEKEFYCVVFRSRRKPDVDTDLYTADRLAHEEAVEASQGNLLMYWFGSASTETRECLATCIWSSRSWAQRTSKLPKHVQAAKLSKDVYESFELERYSLIKKLGTRKLILRKL